jgi:hypothetical protein
LAVIVFDPESEIHSLLFPTRYAAVPPAVDLHGELAIYPENGLS